MTNGVAREGFVRNLTPKLYPTPAIAYPTPPKESDIRLWIYGIIYADTAVIETDTDAQAVDIRDSEACGLKLRCAFEVVARHRKKLKRIKMLRIDLGFSTVKYTHPIQHCQ